MEQNKDYVPFFQRKRSWFIILGIAISLAGLLGVISGASSVIKSLKTEEDVAVVVSKTHQLTIWVEKYSAVREYNKSDVPMNAWDIDEDEYKVCDRRDSTGLNCLEWHWETDYDYNIMDWNPFTEINLECQDELCSPNLDEFKDKRKWKVSKRNSYYISLIYGGNISKHKVDNWDYEVNDKVPVRVYIKSKKIKSVIE